MSESYHQRFQNAERDQELMCKILRHIREEGGAVKTGELHTHIEGYEEATVDRNLRALYEEGYFGPKERGTNVKNVPDVVRENPDVRRGIEELCATPVDDFFSWLWKQVKLGSGNFIQHGISFALGAFSHWLYTLFF